MELPKPRVAVRTPRLRGQHMHKSLGGENVLTFENRLVSMSGAERAKGKDRKHH